MSSFSIDALWRALSDAHEPRSPSPSSFGSSSLPGRAWTRMPGPAGVDDGWSFGRTKLARVMRLRHAIEDSLPLAFEELQRLLGAISFAEVRQVLVTLVRDIALVWCGSVILGGGLGGVIGAFGAGAGAVPGAAIGASVGASAGEALLALFGLKALAESMAASMPRALRAYQQGARDAWDDPPFHDADDGHESFRMRQAAWELAQGHLALMQALLTALLAMLSRGGTARALALHEIGANSRLGPAMARWLEEQEAPLRQALSRAGRRSEYAMTRQAARAPLPAVTPAQLRAEVQARKAGPTRPAIRTTSRDTAGPNGASLPLGSKRLQLNQPESPWYQPIRNDSTTIGEANYSGHAIDRMQDRGIMPSVIRNTIDTGVPTPSRMGTTVYHDAVNNVSVVTNAEGKIITVKYGR